MSDVDEINTKVNFIMTVLNKMELKIEEIQKKINDITQIYTQYIFNKNLKLHQTNSYLKFQIDFLFNEKNYFSNIKNYFIKKFVEDLYGISEYIILILISLDNLDIGLITEKNNIMNKIIKSDSKLKFSWYKNYISFKSTYLINILKLK